MEACLLPLATIVPTDYLCSIMEARLLPLATIVPTDYLQGSQPPSSLAGGSSIYPAGHPAGHG